MGKSTRGLDRKEPAVTLRLPATKQVGGVATITIKPGQWYPFDVWLAAWEAAHDAGGSYYAWGLKSDRMWK
jgi:hypothetical protein